MSRREDAHAWEAMSPSEVELSPLEARGRIPQRLYRGSRLGA